MEETVQLRAAGLKVTSPRVRILQIFSKAQHQHLSAEDVYKAVLDMGEDIGLATVYRVLSQFEAAGLIVRHHFEGGYSVFELQEVNHHDHLICILCGRVEEFVDEIIEQRQHVVAEKNGFVLSHHTLNLYGRCRACQLNHSS